MSTRPPNTDEATAEGIAVAPRKVKTMVVRADGSLAPREDRAPVAAPETTSPETTATTAEAHPLQPAVEPWPLRQAVTKPAL